MIDEWQDRKTIGKLLDETAAKFGGREAWVFNDERITFRALRDRVNRLAGGLLRLGVRKGDKVGVWMPNCMEWIYTYLAVVKIGAAIVPVNTRFKPREVAYIIDQSDASTLVVGDRFLNVDFVAMIRELCPELAGARPGQLQAERLPKLRNVICHSTARYDGMYAFAEVMNLGNDFADAELDRVTASVDPNDLAIMIYTSGSTGFPKGVVHSHKIIRNMTGVVQRLAMTEQDCILLFLPLFHGYGAVGTTISATIAGTRLVLMESFEAGESLRLMERERVTLIFGMETIFRDQLRHPDFPHRDLSSLRTGICPSGTPNAVPLVKEVLAKMCPVRGAYGMTETTAITALTLDGDPPERVYNTSGFPLPGFQLKTVDTQTGQTLPANCVGEICAKGHPLMLGYYKKPEETAKVIDGDGWFHTGDLGLLDERGYLRFVGRTKDIFRIGGENADPVEVETLLLQHPAISAVQVTGVPDKRLGEVGMAFVQFKPGQRATEQDLIAFCKGKLANFKVPRHIMQMDEYPLTPVGKVHKAKLRELAVEFLGLEE